MTTTNGQESARGKASRGERRRAEILQAAAEVFVRSGYAGATVDEIANVAQASKATIYSFFGDKAALFAAVIVERAESVLALDLGASGGDVEAALARFARRYIAAVLSPEILGLYRLVIAEGPRFPDIARAFFSGGPERIAAQLGAQFERWRAAGLLAVDDPLREATRFLETLRGDLHLRALAGLLSEPPEREVALRIAEALSRIDFTPPGVPIAPKPAR
ncbi:TetR/AcrR family transcriptional regulator [Alsobacter soli]|uniref:TetR/AcrR family transcriptional regulator n=1 Tax=Alsobacter soli TaxID=2109933 RepID=A0A2T1HN51_9HYPH|nr:TetR/AcrR family transcriptional regulator [Alsobacter soli]PSC03072.1 TetR/AcrR family transcriptional regulator [Alsobacter soli]